MSKTSYPKGSQEPTRNVGDDVKATDWPETTRTVYPGVGVSGTDYNGHKNKTLTLGGGEGGKSSKDYPKKKRSFPCEGFR